MTRRPRAVFAHTATSLFMATMDNLVVTLALPRIREDLGGDLESVAWTVNAYLLTFGVALLTGALVGDRFGRRRVYLIGIALFTAASAAGALSDSTLALALARAAQGLGAALIVPLSLTLLVQTVSRTSRTMAIAGLSAVNGLAIAAGPFLGGLIVQLFDWHWIFWINVPIGVLLLALGPVLPRDGAAVRARLDWTGLVVLMVGLCGLTAGLVRSADHGWASVWTLAPLLLGLAVLAAWAWGQRNARTPLVPRRLIASRGFRGTNVVALLVTAAMFGVVFLMTQFLQSVMGYGPLEAGLRTLPWTVMPLLAAPVSGILADRVGTRAVLSIGVGLQVAALAWLALVIRPEVSYAALVPGLVLAGIGMGAFFAVVTTQTLAFGVRADEGVASGVANAVREIAVLLGIAVLAAVWGLGGGQLASAAAFSDGLRAALLTGTLLIAAAFVVSVRIPRPPVATPDLEPADIAHSPSPTGTAPTPGLRTPQET